MDQKQPMHFPNYLHDVSIGWEVANTTLQDRKANRLLNTIFCNAQQIEAKMGLRFAEQHFLTKNPKTLTPEWLEWFIKALHRSQSFSKCLVNAGLRMAGHYSDRRLQVVKETGNPTIQYAPPSAGDQMVTINYQVIRKLNGAQAAKQYKAFCNLLATKLKSMQHSYHEHCTSLEQANFFSNRIDIKNLIDNDPELADHPGYPIYLDCQAFTTHPNEIPKQMKALCKTLVQMMQSDQNPYAIAAKAMDINLIHPFPDGNGQLSRTLMNCILMVYGKKPLSIQGKAKKAYYRAVEKAEQDSHVLVRFIQQACERNNLSMTSSSDRYEGIPSIVNPDTQLVTLQFEDRMDVVHLEVMPTIQSMLPMRMGIQKGPRPGTISKQMHEKVKREFFEHYDKLLTAKYDSAFFLNQAKYYANTEPCLSGYFALNAISFLNNANHPNLAENSAQCYLFAAQAAHTLQNYTMAYAYSATARLAYQRINPEHASLHKCDTLLSSLSFVPKLTALKTPEDAEAWLQSGQEPTLPKLSQTQSTHFVTHKPERSSQQFIELGTQCYKEKRYDAALEHYLSAQDKVPPQTRADIILNSNIGMCYLYLNNPQGAITSLQYAHRQAKQLGVNHSLIKNIEARIERAQTALDASFKGKGKTKA